MDTQAPLYLHRWWRVSSLSLWRQSQFSAPLHHFLHFWHYFSIKQMQKAALLLYIQFLYLILNFYWLKDTFLSSFDHPHVVPNLFKKIFWQKCLSLHMQWGPICYLYFCSALKCILFQISFKVINREITDHWCKTSSNMRQIQILL